MKIDFKELGLQLVVVVLAIVLYHHVIAPMMSGTSKAVASPVPSPVPATNGDAV